MCTAPRHLGSMQSPLVVRLRAWSLQEMPRIMIGATLVALVAPRFMKLPETWPIYQLAMMAVCTFATALSTTPANGKASSMLRICGCIGAMLPCFEAGVCALPCLEAGCHEYIPALVVHAFNALVMLIGAVFPRYFDVWTMIRGYLVLVAVFTGIGDLHLHRHGAIGAVFPAPGGTSTLGMSLSCVAVCLVVAAVTTPAARKRFLDFWTAVPLSTLDDWHDLTPGQQWPVAREDWDVIPDESVRGELLSEASFCTVSASSTVRLEDDAFANGPLNTAEFVYQQTYALSQQQQRQQQQQQQHSTPLPPLLWPSPLRLTPSPEV